MKGCVQWNPFTVKKISPRAGLELGTARSVGQRLTHRTTGAPLSLIRVCAVRSVKEANSLKTCRQRSL